MNNREAMQEAFEAFMANDEKFPDGCNMTERVFNAGYQAALASQAQQDKEANSNRLTDAQIEDIGKEILNHGTHEWEGLQPWVYVFARRIASVSEQLLGNLEEFKLSEAQQDHIPDGGKMVQQTESRWRPIATAPKNKKIIVRYKNVLGKDRTVFAKYIEKFTEESTFDTECETDYCEEDDTFYLKEGWVELIDNWDEFSSVYFDSQNVPTHWMPLPPAPEGGDK